MRAIFCTAIVAIMASVMPAWAALPAREEVAPAPVPGDDRDTIPPGLALAVQKLRENDPAAALTAARAFVKSHPSSGLGREVLGEAARRRGLWAEAEHAFNEALRLEPARVSARLRLGLVDLATRNVTRAEQRFRDVVAAVPTLPDGHRALGLALARQGKFPPAIAAMEEAVRLAGDSDVVSRIALASVYYEANRPGDAERVASEVLARNPDHQAARLILGAVDLDAGRTDEASAHFEQVAIRNPGSASARLGRALVFRARGKLAEARTELGTVIKDNPEWTLARIELARTLLMQRDVAAASKVLDDMERLGGDPRLLRLRGAALLLRGGFPAEAIQRAQPLLNETALAPAARDVLVRAYLQQQRPDEAEQLLTAAVSAVQQDFVARMHLGRFYLARRRGQDALMQFDRAAAIRPDAQEVTIGQAEAHVLLNDGPAAVAAAQKLVKIRGEAPEAGLFLASIQQRLGRTSDAVQTLQESLGRHPGHFQTARGLAALYDREGKQAEAVTTLQQAAQANPESAAPWTELGSLLQRHGQMQAAATALREGLKREPENPVVLNNLAYLLARTPAGLEEAGRLSEQAYARRPRNPSIADTRGWILVQQGQARRGLPLLEEAARQVPSNPVIRYHLGVAYANLGRRADARRALEQALGGAPFAEADAARTLLDSLR